MLKKNKLEKQYVQITHFLPNQLSKSNVMKYTCTFPFSATLDFFCTTF